MHGIAHSLAKHWPSWAYGSEHMVPEKQLEYELGPSVTGDNRREWQAGALSGHKSRGSKLHSGTRHSGTLHSGTV